jgi:tRNA-Thr(GGU) m(6)t(6)A37 methyltransferase TsaA
MRDYISIRRSTIALRCLLLTVAIGLWIQSDKLTMTVTQSQKNTIDVHAIGIIRTPFLRPEGTPIQPSRAAGAKGVVEVFSPYRQGLKDLEGFERVWLVYSMHLVSEARLLVTPFLDTKVRGVFATRAPARPNAIGISSVRLLRIDGSTMEVAGVDIVDGTPLLDIKPYVPEFDCFPGSRAGWFDESQERRSVADDRFSTETSVQDRLKR